MQVHLIHQIFCSHSLCLVFFITSGLPLKSRNETFRFSSLFEAGVSLRFWCDFGATKPITSIRISSRDSTNLQSDQQTIPLMNLRLKHIASLLYFACCKRPGEKTPRPCQVVNQVPPPQHRKLLAPPIRNIRVEVYHYMEDCLNLKKNIRQKKIISFRPCPLTQTAVKNASVTSLFFDFSSCVGWDPTTYYYENIASQSSFSNSPLPNFFWIFENFFWGNTAER